MNDVLNITHPTKYELSWFLPEDNGEPIDYFEVSYFPVAYNPETLSWSDRGNLARKEIPHGNVRLVQKS